jgi:Ataxin-2 C-terminal region
VKDHPIISPNSGSSSHCDPPPPVVSSTDVDILKASSLNPMAKPFIPSSSIHNSDDPWPPPEGVEITSLSDEDTQIPFDKAKSLHALETNIPQENNSRLLSPISLETIPALRSNFPETNLLCQLEAEVPLQSSSTPIQVFAITTSDQGHSQPHDHPQPHNHPQPRDLAAAQILAAEPDFHTTQDVHLGILSAIRGAIVEGIRRIGARLATQAWKSRIDQRPVNDPVRLYFYRQCYLFRFLDRENKLPPPSSPTSHNKPIRFLESNPLLTHEEIEFLRNASMVFRSNRRFLLADAINAVLDMRFRRSDTINALFDEGYFDIPDFSRPRQRPPQ